MLYNILVLIENRSGENERGMLYSHIHSSYLQADLQDITTSKEYAAQKLINQRKKTGVIKSVLQAEVELESTLPLVFQEIKTKL